MQASSSGGIRESQQDQAVQKSLERYIMSRIQGVGPNRAANLVGKHGAAVLDILNGNPGDCMRMLTAIPGIGTKTAEKMLRSWVLNLKKSAYLHPAAFQFLTQLSPLGGCFLGLHALPP